MRKISILLVLGFTALSLISFSRIKPTNTVGYINYNLREVVMERLWIFILLIGLVTWGCEKGDDIPVEVFTIKYPREVNELLNVLSDSVTQIVGGQKYCVAAYVPQDSLIKVTIGPSPDHTSTGLGIFQMENDGWKLVNIDASYTVLKAIGSNRVISISWMTGPPTSVEFCIYENNSVDPTKIRVLKNY